MSRKTKSPLDHIPKQLTAQADLTSNMLDTARNMMTFSEHLHAHTAIDSVEQFRQCIFRKSAS